MSLGNRLKTLRKKLDITQEELIEELSKRGVDVNRITVSRWENDKQEPMLAPVMALADIFNVSAEYIAKGINEHTQKELKLNTHIEHTVETMTKLNEVSQEEVSKYADYVFSNKNNRIPLERQPAKVSDLMETYTIGTAAAGSGFNYGDHIIEHKLFMTTDIPEHDFSLNVKGDSMFPTIIDGETIFIIKDYDKIDNDIYVLDIDGETTVKRVKFGKDEIILISDNEEYDDRIVTGYELANTRILGRVVGWEMPT